MGDMDRFKDKARELADRAKAELAEKTDAAGAADREAERSRDTGEEQVSENRLERRWEETEGPW
ncbi:hypothetical protein [Kitasatospora camelliae]|uniref:CsbD-like protein n=1 Tax=Kitasatospora camelliae TaxID=3156397 RepID=A0AAU8JWQ2_9ACTN